MEKFELLIQFENSGMTERAFWRAYYPHLTYSAFHGQLWRAKQKIESKADLFTPSLGKMLELDGDWIIVGDVQLPTTDYDFAALPAAIAKRHLKKPRQLAIVGDLMNRCRGVVDCFLGTGTTIIAAEKLGRDGRGIELSPAYVDVAIKRWQDFTGQKATLDGDGRTFDELANERLANKATV